MALPGSTSNGQTRILKVSDVIDNRPMSSFQFRTILLGGLVLFTDGFDAQTIGFLATPIARSTGIPINTFGPIFSASLIGLMIAAMLAGPIADRRSLGTQVACNIFHFNAGCIFCIDGVIYLFQPFVDLQVFNRAGARRRPAECSGPFFRICSKAPEGSYRCHAFLRLARWRLYLRNAQQSAASGLGLAIGILYRRGSAAFNFYSANSNVS